MNAVSDQYIQLPLWPPSGQVSALPDTAFIPGVGPSLRPKKKRIRVYYPEYHRQWRKKHPECYRKWLLKHPGHRKQWALANREKINKKHREWVSKNYEQYKALQQKYCKKRQATIKGQLNSRISGAIGNALHGSKNWHHWENLVGYTVEELKRHLESLFSNGMTWDLFLKGKIHIDHKVPQSFFIFDKLTDQEFLYCWSLDNLQPLWAHDNFSKNTKTMEEWEKYKGEKINASR